MRWTFKDYLREIVLRLQRKIRWPKHIPFDNLSQLKGGIRTLLELRRLLYSKDPEVAIRFEPVTPEDCAKVISNPLSLHPNLALAEIVKPIFEPLVVVPTVLHPGDFSHLGDHPTSTQPCAIKKGFSKKQRKQRSDVKRRHRSTKKSAKASGSTQLQARHRPPKHGITSFTFVLPETSQASTLRSGDGSTAYHLTDDPIDEFVPSHADDADEIESASGDWPERN
ncbi:hypothetical protein FKP32DRAFT_1687419 [Trametes sanguinea]|nr:hypothetical protein FKP32DRAFT_1687419 [Trametes sanguinea]